MAYVEAVATQAGCTVTKGPYPDRESVDMQIRAHGGMQPCLDVQLKATTTLGPMKDGNLVFSLKVKNYEDLRRRTLVPRLLVVLDLPKDEEQWLTVEPARLVLRKCAYWLKLTGFPEHDNKETVSVRIPAENIFDMDAVRELMHQAESRELR